jgi:hypothetical protein
MLLLVLSPAAGGESDRTKKAPQPIEKAQSVRRNGKGDEAGGKVISKKNTKCFGQLRF